MRIPTTLKHKPVVIVENYEKIDGSRVGNTDAAGLSLGLAQWNDRGKVEVSAKVWRYTGEKWSRQSEELPLNRVLDLATLICRTKLYFREEAYRLNGLFDGDHPDIDALPLHGDAMRISVCTDNPMIEEDIKLFYDALSKEDEMLGEHLQALARVLKELGY